MTPNKSNTHNTLATPLKDDEVKTLEHESHIKCWENEDEKAYYYHFIFNSRKRNNNMHKGQ